MKKQLKGDHLFWDDDRVCVKMVRHGVVNRSNEGEQDIYESFTMMLLFYKDILNLKIGKIIQIFTDYVNEINNVEEKNTLDEITSKINVIMDLREKIKFNINSNLLMDKLIIELKGCETK